MSDAQLNLSLIKKYKIVQINVFLKYLNCTTGETYYFIFTDGNCSVSDSYRSEVNLFFKGFWGGGGVVPNRTQDSVFVNFITLIILSQLFFENRISQKHAGRTGTDKKGPR